MEAEPGEPGRRERLRRLLRPPPPRVLAAAYAAAVAAAGAYGLWFQGRLPARLPAALDWSAAAVLLERDARPGDAVALAPMWAERAREVLPASLPVLALPRYRQEDEDLVGVRRVWLLALPEAPGHSGAIEADLAARASAHDGPQRLGALEVTRFDLRSPTLPLAWLPDWLSGARVSAGGAPCARDARGDFRCPGTGAVVAREVREIRYLPRPCLRAEPGPGAALTVEFPAVPVGRVLRGHTGIIGDAMLSGRSPVRVVVQVDGEPVAALEEPPRSPGWHPFRLDTSRFAGRSHDLAFLVSTDDPGRRPFCFEAMTLP